MRFLAASLATCALVLAPAACAVGFTSEQEALLHLLRQQAPLAFSADGAWRFHMDAKLVLHRTGVANGSVRLARGAHALASSRSGQRVVFSSDAPCVGLVEFGDGSAQPTLRWLPGGPRLAELAPGMPPEEQCGGTENRVIDISPDGRLLATPSHVVDIDSGKVVATLPQSGSGLYGRMVAKIAFIDNGSRLLVVSRTMGEGWESAAMPSKQQVAVWNLADGSLRRLDTYDGEWVSDIGNFIGYLPSAAAYYRIDGARRLRRHRLDVCGSASQAVLTLPSAQWSNIAADPHGRWIAGIQERNPKSRAAGQYAGDVDEEVLIHDLASGKQIARFHAPHGIRGLTVSADGRVLHGLTAAAEGEPGDPNANRGGDPVSFVIPADAAPVREAASSARCAIDDETPAARLIPPPDRPLTLMWRRPLADDERLSPGKRDELWIDDGDAFRLLDPATGRTRASYPRPIAADESIIAAPGTNGYIRYRGDALLWQPFRAGDGRTRVIDRRRGWHIGDVKWQGRSIAAVWQAGERTRVRTMPDGTRRDGLITIYDAATRKLVNTRSDSFDEMGIFAEYIQPATAQFLFAPCVDWAGPMRAGFDWRVSHFDSLRLLACGPKPGQGKTILWDGLSVAALTDRAVLGQFGSIALAREGNTVRVFDMVKSREIGRIEDSGQITNAFAIPGLILVESIVRRNENSSREVAAYLLGISAAAEAKKK